MSGAYVPPPRLSERSSTVLTLVLTLVVVPVAAWLFGVALLQCVLVAAIGVTIGLAIRFRPRGEESVWSPETVDLARDRGARRDVARLSWSVGDDQVGRALRIRLYELAERRLATRGLDLDEPGDREAIETLLGRDAVRVLDAELGRAVPAHAFERAVAALERLDQPDPTTTTTPVTPTGTHEGVR
ncbi:hypothetical protein FHX74_002351 [Friedmanniella endophytica]|uniref:Uncharacterized protein n=1 Tax=Microlunatus kandeliicorticis TaxID=1759536 RepID=A0A7W3IT36_9ACTN|nr:hypothetical protein [Microlunatus kandeliicorticis]MBA8794732.1 hypothetical protein [Microlunatus kandeliicorticis]